jgi:hypothetical protein
VEPATADPVTFTVTGVTGDAWYFYDPANVLLNTPPSACVTSVNVANPGSGINLPPVANAQAVVTDQDTAAGITLTGSDPEGAAITFTVTGGPANGTLTGTAPNLTYTPNGGYTGADSFTFVTNDGVQNSAAATVAITVNPTGGGGGGPVAAFSNIVVTDKGEKWLVNATVTITDGGVPVVGQKFTVQFSGGEAKKKATNGAGQINAKGEITAGNSVILSVVETGDSIVINRF